MPVIEYKCSSCGSGMAFDGETGTLSCVSCGKKDNIEHIPDPLKQQVFTEDEVKEYRCGSCGAVLLTEAETSATTCSFCGSAVVLGDRVSGELAPAMVIPFAITKEQAVQAFRKWCRNGLLTPSGFMTANRIKDMTGVYVPFWLYDLDNRVEARGHATRVRSYTKGDYRYTETQHFEIYRKVQLNYKKVPIDASEKMNDELMDRLEPFPYEQLKSFKTPYLAGYIAEKYSHTDEELYPRVQEKIRSFIDSYLSSAVTGYTTVNFTDKQVDTTRRQSDYVLLPVWMVNYDYNKKVYTFAMNGQTGKVVGKPPHQQGENRRVVRGRLMRVFPGAESDRLVDGRRIVVRKRLALFVLLSFAALIALSSPLAAAAVEKPLLFDEAGLLSREEADEWEALAREYGAERETDFIVYTSLNDNNLDVEQLTAQFYDDRAPGYDKPHGNAVILTLDMRNREVYMAGFGKAEQYLDYDRLENIQDAIADDLANGNFKEAFEDYLMEAHRLMGYQPGMNPDNLLFSTWFQLAVSLVIGGIVVGIMLFRSGGRVTVNARTYNDPATSGMLDQQDRYIRTTTTKQKIQKNNGGGGGGRTPGGHSYSGSKRSF